MNFDFILQFTCKGTYETKNFGSRTYKG
jgi:hypothetical protein